MAYCEDYPCCGHSDLDPCPGRPLVLSAEQFDQTFWCDDCGMAHPGPCADYEDEEPDEDEDFTAVKS